MIACLTGGKALPVAILQQLVMKTDGVPLFVEEFTKMVLESDVLRESAEGYTLASPLATLAIPTTLQDSLMARLDRLSPVKEVAQLGATVGREFSYALLRAVAPLDEPSLQSALAHLVAAEILYGRGLAPQARYFFKHALIQETAYQSLLRSRRQQYHHKIAQVLAVDFPDITETQPEVVAHHYTEAGLAAQAIPYWQYAGQRATERSAYVEAIAHLTRGLEVLQTLPDTPEHVSQELTLHLALGVPLVATRGYGASEVEKVYARAHKLCHHMGETPQLVPVLRGLGIFYTARAELHTARELGEQLLTLAQGLQDSGALLEAHFTLGAPLFYLGEFVLASHHMEQGVALYDPQQHRGHAAIYGQDAGVACLGFTAWALWLRGYPDAALTRSYEALSLAQELAHPYSLAWAMVFVAVIHHLRREGRQTRERAEVEMALASEQGFPFWVAAGMCFWGWALMTEGQVTQGVGQISQGLRIWQTTGAELIKPYFLSMLAEAYGHDKQMAAGLGVLAEARTLGDTHGERWWHAELYRFEGEFFLQQGSPDAPQAARCFHQAIALARHQQAKSLELRAAMSLTRLWQRQGQRAEAYELLAPIYGWFTEGFDTPDLQEAKALLEELEA